MSTKIFSFRSVIDADIVTNSPHIYQRMIERGVNVKHMISMFTSGSEYILDEVDSGFEVMFRSISLKKSLVFSVKYNESKDIIDVEMITCIGKYARVSSKCAHRTHVYNVA